MNAVNHYLTVSDGVKLRYRRHGAGGSPIVFLCGLGDNLTSWQSQVDAFSPTNMVITLDNRGSGESETPEGPYSIPRMVDDVHELVESLGCGPVVAVGVSMGGAICQEWALRYPKDIDRMVLCSTWAAPDIFLDTIFSHWQSMARAGNRRALIESLLLFCWSPDYLSAHPEVIQPFIEEESLNPPGLVAAADACRAHDAMNRIATIAQETLILIGAYDILIRPDLSHALADQLPRVRVETMQTGHMPYWEQPDEFAAIVRDFIAA
ncbi:MAG: alpha/beta hydrolase [Alphaproteobacteria bacterium]